MTAEQEQQRLALQELVKAGQWQQAQELVQALELDGLPLLGADLRRADLQGADLKRADLTGASLRGEE